MTRCANEREWPGEGLNWTPPEGLGRLHLETERLVVRLYTLDDADAMYASVVACREYLTTWMDWVHQYQCLEAAQEYIVKNRLGIGKLLESRSVGVGIFERDSGAHVGGTGFHGLMPDTASTEMGYWVRSDMAGRGYATEASGVLISYLLRPQDRGGLGLDRVRAFCAGDNIASRRVLAKLGMPVEVVQRRDYFVKGFGVTDRIGFGVMQGEWDTDRHSALDGVPETRLSP